MPVTFPRNRQGQGQEEEVQTPSNTTAPLGLHVGLEGSLPRCCRDTCVH